MRETAVRFGERQHLFGIVTEPDPGALRRAGTAVLLLNAGILHTAGPSCLYVSLARRLAEEGYVVLRFDFAGIGDSEPRADTLTFDQGALIEARAAMDLLAATHGVERFLVAGICSGAVQSYRVALADPRVVGAAMLNPQGYFASSGKRIESYVEAEKDKQYLLRVSMRRKESWLRLLRGEVDLIGLAKALSARALRPFAERGGHGEIAGLAQGFAALVERGTVLLHVYAEEDPGLIELDLVARAMPAEMRRAMRPEIVPAADHLFTPLHAQRSLLELLRGWLATATAEKDARAPAKSALMEQPHAASI
jgi:pimeloyl-ACP methyl ester carboxylesterase